jgi:HAD superfamily hydrolase (TIGR01509 family)
MDELQLVIFDCDGVLVDSEVISNEVLAQALTAEGLPTTLAESRSRYQGLLLDDVVTLAEAQLGGALPGNFLKRYEQARSEAFRRELAPVPFAAEAVRRIDEAGLAKCVASQGKLEKTKLSLELTGLRDLFAAEELFSAYSVPRGKPYPDLFLHAAATMQVEPSRSVVVEDSPSGVAAGVAAGMRVFGYIADSDEVALREEGAEILRSMEELPGLLGL